MAGVNLNKWFQEEGQLVDRQLFQSDKNGKKTKLKEILKAYCKNEKKDNYAKCSNG
jgi:hypothetical protein